MRKNIRKRVFFLSTGLVLLFLCGLWTEAKGQTSKVELPRTLNIATHPIGSIANTVGTGLATVLTKHLPTVVKVMPTTGPREWLPMITTAEVDMGILTTYDAKLGRHGKEEFKEATGGKGSPIYLLTCGFPVLATLIVAEDSGIRKGSDLKGKRVVTSFSGSSAQTGQAGAQLANLGLKIIDVKGISVIGVESGTRAVIEGRADAAGTGFGAAIISELEAAKGARFISLDPSPEAVQRMQEHHPCYVVQVLPGLGNLGVKEPTWFMAFDMYFAGSEKLSNDVAYNIVKTLWEYNQELGPIHVRIKEWTKERFVSQRATIPYHPGTIKFYKEMGVWKAEMDNLQRQLLEEK